VFKEYKKEYKIRLYNNRTCKNLLIQRRI